MLAGPLCYRLGQRLERAVARASAIAVTASRPVLGEGVRNTFWLRQFQRIAQNLVFQGLLAEQSLQSGCRVLQRCNAQYLEAGTHFFSGPPTAYRWRKAAR
jgi:hypothetical protein